VNPGAGSLTISARRAGSRTIVERLRYDGISRCSRAFAQGDAALVVMSQLGPGVVRGDAVTTCGRVDSGAHLIVTNQAATRLLGGARPSSARATWSLATGAVLELIGEPLIAQGDARYESSTSIELAADSFVLLSELARVPPGARVRLRTQVSREARVLFYDAFEAAEAAPSVVGTFTLIGVPARRVGPLVVALDETADRMNEIIRIGIGALPAGAFGRLLGNDMWAVRTALGELRETAWTSLRAPFAPSFVQGNSSG
jgi:urease accessory protein UreH